VGFTPSAWADTTITIQIALSADDVNEVSNSLDGASSSIWLGNGGSTTASYTGLRFTNVAIPQGAMITSARLQVFSVQNQWITYGFIAGADASGNSAAFSSSSRPSTRPLTTSSVAHNDNVNWSASTWYTLDEMKSIVQEIVNRADWQSGNSLSLVLKGSGSGTFGRKFVGSFDGGAANAPKLVVSYSVPAAPAPTVTVGASPGTITSGQSTTLTWSTTNATNVTIDHGVGTVSTSGSIAVSPAATTTYTVTASGSGGTATATATVTVNAPPPSPPTASLNANPPTIAAGASSTLTWTTTNATSVTIDQGIGSVAASGSLSVAPAGSTTYTLTASNSAGTVTKAATITVASTGGSVTTQIGSSADDVNEINSTLTSNATTVWLGNGGSATTSYTGLRFASVAIPAGATISSAQLQVYSSQSQWMTLSFNMFADASGNSAAFSSTSRPSQRTRTASVVAHSDNVSWAANTWYSLDEMKSVVQEVVNRSDWASGHSLSIILNGTGSGTFGRKFVASFDGNPANAPRLIVSYATGGAPMPTASISVSPTAITTGGSASLSWTTSNASSVNISPGIGTVAVSGSTSVSPSVTTAYTITASNQTGTATQTTTLTVNGSASSAAHFGVAAGVTDVVPHQLIRTAADLAYVFASRQPFTNTLVAYWTANAGLPNGTSDFNRSAQATLSGVPISVSPAYNGGSVVHVLANLQNGRLVDVPFDLAANTFGTEQVIATDAATVSGDYIGTSGVSSMVDQSGALHVAYWNSANQIVHTSFTSNGSGRLVQASSPVRVDTAGSAHHPSLAVSPFDNSVTVAWVSLATTPRRILARVRSASGSWGTVQNVSNTSVDVWTSTSAGIDIDQGPSVVITADGVKHVSYIENFDATGDYGAVHYASNNGSGWTDVRLTSTYSHDPAMATNAAGDLYIIGHGHPNDAAQACRSENDICVVKRNADGTWAAPTLFAAAASGQSFDSSPSIKWSVVGWNRPETIEFLFFQTPYTAPTIFYGRLP